MHELAHTLDANLGFIFQRLEELENSEQGCRMKKKRIRTLICVVVCVVSMVSIASTVLSSQGTGDKGIYFEQPIPCPIYLQAIRSFFDLESFIQSQGKRSSFEPESFFQAQVKILSIDNERHTFLEENLKRNYPNGRLQERVAARERYKESLKKVPSPSMVRPYDKETAVLKILEVVLGQDPGEEVAVVLPYNRPHPPPSDQPWYIIGKKSQDGSIKLVSIDGRFTFKGWPWQLWQRAQLWLFGCS